MFTRVGGLRRCGGSMASLVIITILLGALGPGPVHGQTPPGTDIWVFRLSEDGSSVDLDSGFRATNRQGYDNQPHFLPGGQFLLFTAIDGTGQADIQRFDLTARTSEPLTRTAPESEYSATLMPGGENVSLIRVEADSAQRLWRVDLRGGNSAVILPDIRPVGYHTWIDEDRLALFVLGSPSTLQIASVGPGPGRIAASDIGRSLYWVPSRGTVSFVQWRAGRTGAISELDPSSGTVRELAPLLEGNEFYAWTPSGSILAGQGSKLFIWTPGEGRGWQEIIDLAPSGVTGITRIAVSPEGDRIAVVGEGR